MKKILAILLSMAVLISPALGMANAQENAESAPLITQAKATGSIDKLYVLGNGIAFKTNNEGAIPSLTEGTLTFKIAAGKVAITSDDTEKTFERGILFLNKGDERIKYRVKDIVNNEGLISANLYDENNELAGKIENAQITTMSGTHLWNGFMTFYAEAGNERYEFLVRNQNRGFTQAEKARAVSQYGSLKNYAAENHYEIRARKYMADEASENEVSQIVSSAMQNNRPEIASSVLEAVPMKKAENAVKNIPTADVEKIKQIKKIHIFSDAAGKAKAMKIESGQFKAKLVEVATGAGE